MASETGERPYAIARRRRIAASGVVGCCALLLACVSSVGARPGAGGGPGHGAGVGAGLGHGVGLGHGAGGDPAGQSSGPSHGAGPERGGDVGRGGSGEPGVDTGQANNGSGQSGVVEADAPTHGAGPRPGKAAGHGEGASAAADNGAHGHGIGVGRGHEESGRSHGVPSPSPNDVRGGAIVGGAAKAAAVTAPSVASAPAAPAAPTAPPSTPATSSRPSGSRSTGSGWRSRRAHPRRAVRPAGSRRPQRAGASAGGAKPALASVATPARGTSTRHANDASHPKRASVHQQPLVTTITKIVDVVPFPVRILLGLLLSLAIALAARSRLAALSARRLERQRAELLEDVGLLQAALLPIPPARIGPVGTSVAYRPADGPAAGGDFYDVFALETGEVAVIVGDISGHGRQALPHTALVRYTLRAYLEAGLSPREAAQTAGGVLERQLGESLATVVVATYKPRERILVYACAGHPPPVVLGSKPLTPITASSAPPIGSGMRTGTRQTVLSLPGRAQVCFHTDGITEARVGSQLFGAERLQRSLAALGSEATASTLMDSVARQTDARPDDMAACLLSVEGGDEPPAALIEQIELDAGENAADRAERFLRACGVDPDTIDELRRQVRLEATRTGSALLEVSFLEHPPKASLRPRNVAALRVAGARRIATTGASR
jgi:serine phosphatase RsbU (regulator of sigma subunit)